MRQQAHHRLQKKIGGRRKKRRAEEDSKALQEAAKEIERQKALAANLKSEMQKEYNNTKKALDDKFKEIPTKRNKGRMSQI